MAELYQTTQQKYQSAYPEYLEGRRTFRPTGKTQRNSLVGSERKDSAMGSTEPRFFNLDHDNSVGYRVKKPIGDPFSLWAHPKAYRNILKRLCLDDSVKEPEGRILWKNCARPIPGHTLSENILAQKCLILWTSINYDRMRYVTGILFKQVSEQKCTGRARPHRRRNNL